MKVKMSTVAEIEVTPELIGQWFANMDDDAQARFFVAAAETAKGWVKGKLFDWSAQFYACGSHLQSCGCSTDDARDLVRAIAHGIETGSHA